jgi:predicted nucleic acid-binding Zn ribbon protein
MALQPSTFTRDVQQYVKLDQQIQSLQSQLKALRQEKQATQDRVAETMIANQWQKRTLDVGQQQLALVERKQYECLSFTYLENKLTTIIPDSVQRDYVLKYLKDQREVKTVHELRQTPKKETAR